MTAEVATKQRKSFCRLCNCHCGMVVELDADEQIVGLRPDKDDLLTEGFACYRGLQAPEAHNGEIRIRHPMKRMADGSFVEIEIEQALDEIADKIREIVRRDGGEALGAYRGTGCGMNASACFMVDSLLRPLGSAKIFSAITIDQSAKWVAAERIGYWEAGTPIVQECDVQLFIGMNPVISLVGFSHNPMKQLKAEIARGLKILVIDPRKSETTQYCHQHLQPHPGEDATVLAGMIRLILEHGWEDKQFILENVSQMDELRVAVAPFTPDYVARRAGISADELFELTHVLAHAERGQIRSGTGANMGRHSNLVEHLVTVLRMICGFVRREGEEIQNPGVLLPRTPKRAQPVPGNRSWEQGYRSRIRDFGLVYGELPTGIMADEILEPGPGQIKGFFCHGGNAAVIVPDQAKVVQAFRSLELLVTVDVHWNPTCALSHYVLPTVMQYERPDLTCWQAEFAFYDYVPFTRYTHAVAKPPVGAKVYSDDYIFWGLAKRLGIQMQFLGCDISMTRPPETDDFLRIAARFAPIPFEELQEAEMGVICDEVRQRVEPRDLECHARLTVCPADVTAEIGELVAEPLVDEVIVANGMRATHRFMVRRHRLMWNSTQRGLRGIRKRLPHNTACINSSDLDRLGVKPGDLIRLTSEIASVDVVAEADDSLRPGSVAMVHGFGILPEDTDPRQHGASANLLISSRPEHVQSINAMPRMTAFPVHIAKSDQSGRLDDEPETGKQNTMNGP